ncbi:MAG: DnaJ C-terminal domain-containing protein [Pseudomonadota bacterium]
MSDPYRILGVSKSASQAEVKSAFRKLAKAHHPDQNKGNPKAQERFAEINSAYEILGDETRRGQYDRGEIDGDGKQKFTGFEGFGGGNPFEGFGQSGGRSQGGFGGAEDILSQMFGDAMGGGTSRGFGGGFGGHPGGRPQSRPQKGADIKITKRVTLEEIAAGKAQVKLGPNRTISLNIPKGVEDGQIVRLKGQGEQGAGGKGDAHIKIAVIPHADFEKRGDSLRVRVEVPLEDAVLGAKMRVPTLEGAVSLKIPAWSNSGNVFRLRGKGLPTKDGGRGDLLAEVKIMLPAEPDDRLIALFKQNQTVES